MRLEQLNFHHLFYFWKVGKLGHLTRAAEELHTSQSAVSAQIRLLEESLGEALFARTGRRLVLTDTGQMVLAYAENIFGLGQELLGRLDGRTAGIVRVRVGSVATLSRNYQENWIRPLLADPQVALTLESGLLEGLLARLVEHRLDVVLTNETVPADPNRPLHCRFLGGQSVLLVGRAERWRPHSLQFPAGLEGQDLALPGPRHALRTQFDALCAAADVRPRLRAEVDDMAMLRLIARDSGWLALLPEVVVQDELRAGTLAVVCAETSLQERFFAITTPHRHRIELLDRLMPPAPSGTTKPAALHYAGELAPAERSLPSAPPAGRGAQAAGAFSGAESDARAPVARSETTMETVRMRATTPSETRVSMACGRAS